MLMRASISRGGGTQKPPGAPGTAWNFDGPRCILTYMTPRGESLQYRSSIPYDTERIGAAAVYCSDGRFGEQVDDLIFNALNLPRYDRLAIPGGAACLAG